MLLLALHKAFNLSMKYFYLFICAWAVLQFKGKPSFTIFIIYLFRFIFPYIIFDQC